RLWFLHRFEPDSPVYNIPTRVGLSGTLAPAALNAALNAVVRRHEALRTRFAEDVGEPVQVVEPALSVELPMIDLGRLAAGVRRRELRRLADAEALRPFDLAAAPLLRAVLLRLEPQEHGLLLTIHHIIADGWSLGVLVRELAACYAAGVEGRPPQLAALPIQYPDFALWQRQWLTGAVLEQQLGYWKAKLDGTAPVLELPGDRPRPAVPSFRGGRCRARLPAAVTAEIERFAKATDSTPFMVLAAAFKALLYRYTRQRDLWIGTPIANRERLSVEALIGFFVNTLVLRTDLRGELSFRELLGRVRVGAREAFDHQDLPFEMLVEELQPERDLNRSPLFQV
ncbi:MAG: non-ribosomal peptide synthetase, partial [Bosea sp.]|uniref:condensation domain-containing protein n=1 Tax=Bosea sp. (in: a-proteobacteria) TaxID=1871050 RepID=UPI0031FEE2DB|nr:non-ribosomal peptide synthetase [Bosea sp. (in: a-proteobacteria)]